jgi:hypothetical protein
LSKEQEGIKSEIKFLEKLKCKISLSKIRKIWSHKNNGENKDTMKEITIKIQRKKTSG